MGNGYRVHAYAGQSNEVGYGLGNASLSSVACDSRIVQIGRGSSDMQIIGITNELEYWPSVGQAHGCNPSVARYWAANYLADGDTLGIVPAAHGETSILQWLQLVPDGLNLYDDMAARIRVYLSQPGNNTVDLLTMQLGELDCTIIGDPTHKWNYLLPDVDTWHARMLDFIDKFRADFGVVPFVLSKLSPLWNPPAKAGIEAAMDTIQTERAFVQTVTTKYSLLNGSVATGKGFAHFAAQGQEMQAMRRILAASTLINGTPYFSPNGLVNGAFDAWSNGTCFPLAPSTPTPIADYWVACRNNAGNATISRQAGFNGSAYCTRIQRNQGTADSQTISIFQRIPDSVAASWAGKTVTIAYDMRLGANFSGYAGRFRSAICTAGGSGESFNYLTRSFQSATAISQQYANVPYSTPARWFNTFDVPVGCGELALQLNWAPDPSLGAAGAADYADLGAVWFAQGVVPMGLSTS